MGEHELETVAPWHERVGAAVRYVLDLEPVAVQAAWRALAVLLGASGLVISDEVDGRVTGIIVALYALVEVLTTIRARSRVRPEAHVVEAVEDGQRVAGPASPVATGTVLGPAPTPPFPPS